MAVLLGTRGLVAVALVATGCCKQGKFPSNVTGGSGVTRDELVVGWRVNGDKVCQSTIEAAPGCYVLEVEYSAKYVRQRGGVIYIVYLSPVGLALGAAAAVAQHDAQTHRATYDSGPVSFALRIEPARSYYVTSTFTGDEFLPRIVVSDASGERVGALRPTRNEQELAACRNSAPQASRLLVSSCG